MKKNFNLFLRFLVSLGMTTLIFSRSVIYAGSSDVGTTTALFLKMGFGARPSAMGGTFVGISDDLNALYWNPAGLSRAKKNEFSATYLSWFEDINMQFIGYLYRLSEKSTLAGSLSYLSVGNIEGRDDTGKLTGKVDNYHLSLPLAYSRKINSYLSVGIAVKYISQGYESDKANSIAFDLGGLFSPANNLSLGVNLQNLGPKLKIADKENELPFNLKAGLAYRMKWFPGLTLALDIDLPNDNENKFHSGLEYTFQDSYSLRAGYEQVKNLGNKSGFTAGFGYKTVWSAKEEAFGAETGMEKPLELVIDYALVSYGDFGYTHRLSLGVKF